MQQKAITYVDKESFNFAAVLKGRRAITAKLEVSDIHVLKVETSNMTHISQDSNWYTDEQTFEFHDQEGTTCIEGTIAVYSWPLCQPV